jgi:hypothetical protein
VNPGSELEKIVSDPLFWGLYVEKLPPPPFKSFDYIWGKNMKRRRRKRGIVKEKIRSAKIKRKH